MRTFSAFPFFIAVLALLFLPSCMSLNPISAAKLSTLSPLDANPADLRAAIRLPASLELGKASVKLVMKWSSTVTAPMTQEYPLEITEITKSVGGLPTNLASGEKMVILALSSADVEPFRAFQRKMKAEKAAGIKGRGSLSADFSGGCWRGVYPAGNARLPLEVWLQTAPADDFIPLIQDGDLQAMLSRAGEPTLTTCQ
jgi:hypothetical protein